jgi:hypothetical protein
MVQVVHVKRRPGAPTKRVVDAARVTPPVKPKQVKLEPKPKPEQEQQPKGIVAAPDGPPISAELPEEFRKVEERVSKALTEGQAAIIDRIIRNAGEGHPKTLGLRLVLAASQDEYAATWPIGQLAKALHASGRRREGEVVHRVALGCRTARYRDMAASALEVLNKKLKEEQPS